MSAVALLVLATPILVLVPIGVLVVLTMRKAPPDDRPPKPARAWMWAARRGVALTERSAPFVDAYLRNATSLRVVCVGGALAVSWAFTEATGVDLSAAWLVIILAGYLVGSVWAELALARVPATTTRVASLEVREVRRYQASWVAAGGLALPIVLLGLSAVRLLTPLPDPDHLYLAGAGWAAGDSHAATLAGALLGLVSLAVTTAAQRRIVGRPQPRTEPDLVAADETMRSASVHLLGVTHLVLCLALVIAGGIALAGSRLPVAAAQATTYVLNLVGLVAVVVVWRLRSAPPGSNGGALAPPSFSADEASEAVVAADTATASESWHAPRHPQVVALGVLAVLFGALLGVHWLGAVHADVVAWSPSPVPPADALIAPAPPVAVDLVVENRGALPLTLTRVHWFESAAGVPTDVPPAPTVGSIDVLGAGGGLAARADGSGPIEARVDGHDRVTLRVSLLAPPCPPLPAPGYSWGLALYVDLTTAAGRSESVAVRGASQTLSCALTLPTGPQPDDPEVARAQVQAAFEAVYRGGEPGPGLNPDIDRPEGLDVVARAAAEGGFGDIVRTTKAVVRTIAFDRPDHAWVLYELRSSSNGYRSNRRGEAVLVDDRWKVTRETVCADLALASAHCP